jgi:hypothetical protein
MPNFGDICPRCKKNGTSDSFMALSENSMVCRTCAAQLKAAREETHLCPIDGQSMEKQTFKFVLIDKCPVCCGVWLDRGELKIIRDTIRNDAIRESFILSWLAGFP